MNESNEFNEIIKILFLAANPLDTTRLRIDEETRAIDQTLRQAKFRDRFDIEQQWAVRVGDLQNYLLRYNPHIVHFSGHGSESSGIILEDDFGNSHPVTVRALSQLFSVLKDNIKCVVLNACYTEPQARAIAENIDYVIGMSNAIGDVAAINFATAFYQAIGYGKDIKTAFELACVQIDLAGLDDQDIPKLLTRKSGSERQLRLRHKLKTLQQEWELRSEKIERLRKALAIETNVTTKFQLEQQLLEEEAILENLSNQIDKIEQNLSKER
jgi:hypothetical protein